MKRLMVSVILPTFNEVGNIINLVSEIKQKLSQKGISHEIIVVDDNSSDKTGEIAKKHFSKVANVTVIIRRSEKGLATAIRKGLEKASGEIVCVMDTDFSHDPKLVPVLVEKCQKYEFVVGSRYIRGGGMENKIKEKLSYLFNVFVSIVLVSPVHDNLSGFFAVRRTLFKGLDFDQIFWGYGEYFIRLIYLCKRRGASFAEVPSYYIDRQYGLSKSKFLSMFRDYLFATLALRFNKNK